MRGSNLHSRMCSQKSHFSAADAIYLKLNMGGQVCPSVLDTGSDLTLIPAKYVKAADIKKTNHTPRAVNETTIEVLGEVSLPFVVGRYKGMINGVVTEHVADIILGMDWITEHVTSWEFNRSRVKIDGNYHKLTSRSSDNSWCRRVIPQQDVVIKPRSEVVLSTKVALKRLSDAGQSVIVPERGRPEFNTNFVSRVDATLGLPENIWSTVSDVPQQYTDVFTKSENDRGVSYVVTHKIYIGGEDIQEDHGLQQEAHSGVSGFFGGSADYQGSECESTEVVYSVVAGKDESSSVGQTNGGKVPEDRESLSWPQQGLSAVQRAVPDRVQGL